MAAESTKRIKNQVVEPELCVVCSDRFTAIIRKKTSCTFCKASTCSKCVEHYLLTRHEDAHCLHCRVNYNDTSLQEICTKTYLQQTYFKHRQEVLVNRERANLPPLQEAAQREKATRDIQRQVNAVNTEMMALKKERSKALDEYHVVYVDYYRNLNTHPDRLAEMNRLTAHSDDLRRKIRQKQEDIRAIRWPQEIAQQVQHAQHAQQVRGDEEKKEEEKKRFVRRCTRADCKGFLSTAWKCGMCEWYSCSKCFAVKGDKHDVAHECKKEDVDTADLIRKDCKPCPKCGEFIEKSSGCFAADTPILMWDGGVKMSQDIRVGDELVGDDGTKRTVLDTVTGEDTMYEVIQNTGMNYTVNSKHTLLLKFSGEKSIYWSEAKNAWTMRWFDRDLYEIRTKLIHETEHTTTDEALREMKQFRDSLEFDEVIEILTDRYMALDDEAKNALVGFKSAHVGTVKHERLHTSIIVREKGRGTYFGWKVDANHRFVLNDTTSVRNCHQMFCISCQTPWDWVTGKIVTSGPLHNPHYYEWLKRTGAAVPRNPNDVPCGGFPGAWELVRHPRGMKRNVSQLFYEFHRICMELQDISTRNYRSHLDQDGTMRINIGFLLGDTDEKKWGRLLAINEKKRKRDAEIQEVLGAFRMVAVELINRVQNYSDRGIPSFYQLHPSDAEEYIKALHVEITALITMINDAMKNISVAYSYTVPYIAIEKGAMMGETVHYFVRTKNLAMDAKKKKGETDDAVLDTDKSRNAMHAMFGGKVEANAQANAQADVQEDVQELDSDSESDIDDKELQRALIASMMD